MFLQKTAMVRAHYKTREWYTKKGYDVPKKQRQFFEVNVCDLHPSSSTMIKCKCDYCGREFERMFCKIGEGKHSCKKCSGEKRKEYCREHFGVDYIFQIPEVVKQIQNTQQEHRKSKEYRNSVWEKRKETFAKNHDGYETPFHIPEVVKKAQDTREELYGCKTYFGVMNEEEQHDSRVKCAKTRFINGTTKTSKNQIHLCNLLNGVLNKNIDVYNADILLDNNIIVEYDGFGHFFYDDYFKRDSSTCEEKRTNIILNKGYKIIRIICTNDILPEDNVILKLIEYTKQFDFSIIDCENKIIYHDNKQIQFKEIL